MCTTEVWKGFNSVILQYENISIRSYDPLNASHILYMFVNIIYEGIYNIAADWVWDMKTKTSSTQLLERESDIFLTANAFPEFIKV